MTNKNGIKGKISFRYICNVIGFGIAFIMFFLVLALHYRIFDKYETAEIIRINGITDPQYKFCSGEVEITFILEGEEFTTYYKEPVHFPPTFRVGDKIQYLAKNPNKIFPERIKGIVILSCTEAVIIAVLIGTTIYEIKKVYNLEK